ncbi:MAG TPA: prolyl oligopeptidase family serine peptidase, partial [Hyphomonadaceae bacterium]|nr:prolyl oligopeptidase family serine peptidase [Hyphomonadaceae bacterium]
SSLALPQAKVNPRPLIPNYKPSNCAGRSANLSWDIFETGDTMPKRILFVIASLAALAAIPPASAKPPMDAFGDVPAARGANLSPDGSRMIYLGRQGDSDYLTIYDFATGESVPLASMNSIRARYAYFAGDDHVILIASDQVRMENFIGAHETSAAFSYNLKTRKTVQLLASTDGVYPGQTAFGQILAIDPDGTHVYMPILMGQVGNRPTYDVLKVNLDTGKSVRGSSILGEQNTVDWLVSPTGKAIARSDYDEQKQVQTIVAYENGKSREIFREKREIFPLGLIGVTKDGDLIIGGDEANGHDTLFTMSPADGSMKAMTQRQDVDVDAALMDQADHAFLGVVYSGMFPSYDMADPALDADMDALVQAVSGSSLHLVSWTRDRSQLLVLVEGGNRAERYMLFDRARKKLSLVSYLRPDITPEEVGEVTTIEYKARDGITIPALVTWPAGVPRDQRKKLPMIVMPHGGPASYDSVGFDWLAQFLANEGYLVLQPNFRGSSGFGSSFQEAGHKEWGRKSQDDVTDGAKALATMGWADPDRVCIVGWSYGGYSALIGGALTPDLYKCVVSIAGVSDLRSMLSTEKNTFGSKNVGYIYWKEVIGDPDTDAASIDAVSPARLAANFTAPVLLVHGSEDSTVQVSQSDKMSAALKSAGKDVTYIRIRGDDHSLVDNKSRHQMLKALGDFLAKYTAK